MALFLAGGVVSASAQPVPSEQGQGGGPVATAGAAVMQSYALKLRDAEARLRAAHERMATGSAQSAQSPTTPPIQQELMDAALAAWDTIRNPPAGFENTDAYRTTYPRFGEALERLRRGRTPPERDADAAREMLQALTSLREAAGAPAAPTATGAPEGAPAAPAAQGGERS